MARASRVLLFFLLLSATSPHLRAESADGKSYVMRQTEQLLKDMPKDVVDVIDRADACAHHQTEPAWNEDGRLRKEQVVKELGCRDLQRDIKALRQQYAGSAAIVKNLNYVAREYLIPSYDTSETERLIRNMPSDVVELISRADQCVFYQNAQPTDENDTAATAADMEELRCQDLQADLRRLSQQYASSDPILGTLRRLQEHYLREGGISKSQ